MFLTKSAILKDSDFLQELANTIFRRFGVKGLETTLLKLDEYAEDNDVLTILCEKLIENAKNKEMFNIYANNLLSSLENSFAKDDILEKFSIMLEAYRIESKKKSNQPWIEMVGDFYDEDEKRMKVSFDWNDAFIKLLKQKGYPGENEDELVQMWLQEIANQR